MHMSCQLKRVYVLSLEKQWKGHSYVSTKLMLVLMYNCHYYLWDLRFAEQQQGSSTNYEQTIRQLRIM